MGRAEVERSRFRIEAGLRPEHREQAVAGYWEAFSRKLRYPLGPRDKATAFIRQVMDPDYAVSAVSSDNRFLGAAGFKTPSGAFVGGSFASMVKAYGILGGLVRAALAGALERSCDENTLLMDGIFVEARARGLGIGTALLAAIERHAAASGLSRVRLDVIDGNPRARALYERQGFKAQSTSSAGILRPVFGFGHATTMLKELG
ncbi:GNAT family N-acetyltransferase [Pelagibius sp. CAU 1746]|uniref:GNAT family N-acetyltransferase n=1 Tax=Pelagibius sp. CAU 1746 TaxID=3140370 RepID=UPI00325BA303